VPDVSDQTLIQAMATLSEAGLVPSSVGEPSSDVPQNRVIRTDPPEGDKLEKGDKIVVYFASEEPLIMPKVIGMTLSDARTALLNVPVDASRITVHQQRDDSCETGKVTRSKPLPTSEMGSTTKVSLWVCAGPESQVPSIGAGTTVEDAERVLRGAGYNTSQEQQYSDSVEAGRVIGTDPSGGAHVAKGETVTILVSSGARPTTLPPTTPPPTEAPTTPPPTQAPTTATPTAPPPTTDAVP
ncbi:MAG TPA: PASTA domain-containing protein, partial [Acidimicrobiales bacterium]|nr:PASTA domain-containing protein [Acidimicrobiales bacterium]